MSDRSTSLATDNEKLRADYLKHAESADQFREVLVEQIGSLLAPMTLGVPVESRVKTWASLEEKLVRKSIELKEVIELDDLVGVRIILLFRRDLDKALEAIRSTFTILSSEDKAAELAETQFGYQSHHYVVQIPKEWLKVPSFVGLGHLKAELQIRTLAQHIWAAASHKLQYKQEESVPPPLKRAIYRASALLEIVDLEFERLLDERQTYSEAIGSVSTSEPLNVDLLDSVLDDLLPKKNKKASELYADLLENLRHFKIGTVQELRDLMNANMKAVLAEEKRRSKQKVRRADADRVRKGVFFSFVGLTRQALRSQFGDEAVDAALRQRTKKRK